jgi:hypothetical protein
VSALVRLRGSRSSVDRSRIRKALATSRATVDFPMRAVPTRRIVPGCSVPLGGMDRRYKSSRSAVSGYPVRCNVLKPFLPRSASAAHAAGVVGRDERVAPVRRSAGRRENFMFRAV